MAPLIYSWWNPAGDQHLSKLMAPGTFKGLYLDHTFFYVRLAIYALLWWYMHSFIVGNSIKQDTTDDLTPTRKNWKRAAPFIIAYALTITFVAFDLMMSLEPKWFSTIFGIYYFGGNFVSTASLMLIFAYYFNREGYLRRHYS